MGRPPSIGFCIERLIEQIGKQLYIHVSTDLFVIADNAGAFTGNFDYFHISAVGGLSPLPESPLGALAIPLAAVGAVAVYAFAPKLKPKAPK